VVKPLRFNRRHTILTGTASTDCRLSGYEKWHFGKLSQSIAY